MDPLQTTPPEARPASGRPHQHPNQPSGGADVLLTKQQRDAISQQIAEVIYELDTINFTAEVQIEKLQAIVTDVRKNSKTVPVDLQNALAVLKTVPPALMAVSTILFNNRTIHPVKLTKHENGQ